MNFICRLILFFFLLTHSTQSALAQIQSPLPISKEADISDKNRYSGIISESYANGSPRLWKTWVSGKADGLWLEWYPDGTLRYRAYWKNGLGNGKWEYFYPNGVLRSESFYINDIAQGIYRSYFENGQLQVDATYLNGKKDGIELVYDVTDRLLKRNRYDNGQLVIDEPFIFEPNIISDSKSNEWGICFTPDGNTAYFTRRDAATNLKRIYETTKTEKGWSEPKIASFSTHEDESPFINNQGDKLFFASFRKLPSGSTTQATDMNLWFMDKLGNGWSEPKPISGSINKSMKEGNSWPANYEAGPITDNAGNLYYWTKGSKSNATNLYFSPLKADGSFGEPSELIEPSSDKHFDSAPQLSPDGNLLFFVSDNRNDALGGSDIYYSKKINGAWSKPKNLGLITNSYSDDSCPSFSPDGKYFFFSSTRAGNKDSDGEYLWDIYYMETKFLNIE